jgi:hypothetical protein
MLLEQIIRELTAQLLRAEHPAVIQTVAAQLQQAIQEYVEKIPPKVAVIAKDADQPRSLNSAPS